MPRRLLDPAFRSRIWRYVADGVVFVTIVIGVMLGAWGAWTIHETHQIVVSHDTELAQTKAIAKDLLSQSRTQTTNHSATLVYLEALCASTPGCPSAVQKLEGG